MTAKRWVCLDVGETLIDETRIWSTWADELGVPRLTFLAALGAVIARGDEHQAVFAMFGFDDWPLRAASVEQAHGGLQPQDLYSDALRSIEALKADGYRVAIVANQPAIRAEQLRSIGVAVDVLEMSEALGVAKPHPDFFDRVIELLGSPAPKDVAYVGDRVDNDVLPAIAAGMRAVWIRRGPWGIIQDPPAGAGPALTVDSLDELVERIGDAWEA
jgi:HAD superfamily hydrolase (TIGR01549 family)